MAGIGIVSNPGSRRNLACPGTSLALRRLLGADGDLHVAGTPEELGRALSALRAAGIDTLAVNGGDGTVHVVVTALAQAWEGAAWPRLLPLRGGSMNTVASAHGLRAAPEVTLQRFLELRRAGREPSAVERDLLQVEAPGQPPRLGFLFGTGLAVAFLEEWTRAGPPSRASALWLLMRVALSAALGGPLAARLTRSEALRVAADGEEWPADAFLSVVAGAIPELGFGFLPLARCGEQPGFFHAVGVTGSLTQLALHLPAVRLARPWHRPLALDAVTRDLLLEAPRLRFTVDGDLYATAGPVRVRSGPVARVFTGRHGRFVPEARGVV